MKGGSVRAIWATDGVGSNDKVNLNYCKALVLVPHVLLLQKLYMFLFDTHLIAWLPGVIKERFMSG